MAFPQPVSNDDKLKAFDSVPLFMRSLPGPEECETNEALSALQSLAYDGTPDEIAENFKEQGNDYYKGKRYREALGFYTQGIDAKPENSKLIEALLCNMAACNLELQNFRSVLRDCSAAITLNSRQSKAYYRSAQALMALGRPDEALDACQRCLEFDPDNLGVKALGERARKLQEAKEKKERERKERLEREEQERRLFQYAFKERGLRPISQQSDSDGIHKPHFEENSLIMPAFFLYPQYAQSDVVPSFHEDTRFGDLLDTMFPPNAPPPDWDSKHEYVIGRLTVYAITHLKRLLKVGMKMTLRNYEMGISALSCSPLFFSLSKLFSSTIAVNETSIDTADRAVIANNKLLTAWLVLNVWPSHLGLPLLIGTILLAKNIRRHATFINLCITWMIIGFSSSILLYSSHQTGPEPPRYICLVQASLLYGQPGMTSMSAFTLVFQLFYVIRAAFREKDPETNETVRKWILLLSPYVAFIVFVVWTAIVGYQNPKLVSRERRFFYCSVKNLPLTNTMTVFSFCVLLITTCLEVWIIYTTYKHWRVLRANDSSERGGTDLNLIIRTAAFGFWVFIGMILSLLSLKAPQSPIPDMVLATMGSAVVLIFGTQRDVLRAWMFCRRKPREIRNATSSEHLVALEPKTSSLSIANEKSSQEPMYSDRQIERKIVPPIHRSLSSRLSAFMASRSATALRALSRRRAPASFTYAVARRSLATAAPSAETPAPPAAGPSDPKISRIVDDISGLTLLQAADLISLLKTRLNIQEIAMPAASAAPVAAAPVEEAPAEEKPKEKTIFSVKLESFEATAKPKIIREVKAMNPTLTLVAAKNFVESLPKVLKENLPKEEAEKMKKAFEALGGVISLERQLKSGFKFGCEYVLI
ncbi:40S ribosomal S7 [Pyrrhoderma noxium]|uniref:40S ribosomal S7 n=1 Tax=Pyrrhoderma noxium TaxID=2282107 RepID=A0A286UNQ9_9AGAM|nr:40S ribosomal S7 [Pyrrhoderma noxium]